MKYFLAIALIATVASAAVVRPTPLTGEAAEIQQIIAAIQSPYTDPATAAALEQMLYDILGIKPEPVSVGPAIVDPLEGISVGPAIIPYPSEADVVEEPSPVVVAPPPSPTIPSPTTPLVQIILNINLAAGPNPIAVSPVDPLEGISVGPAIIPYPSESADIDEVIPTPVHVVDDAPEPVHVVEIAPEPVQIGVPIIPEAAVVLPEELN